MRAVTHWFCLCLVLQLGLIQRPVKRRNSVRQSLERRPVARQALVVQGKLPRSGPSVQGAVFQHTAASSTAMKDHAGKQHGHPVPSETEKITHATARLRRRTPAAGLRAWVSKEMDRCQLAARLHLASTPELRKLGSSGMLILLLGSAQQVMGNRVRWPFPALPPRSACRSGIVMERPVHRSLEPAGAVCAGLAESPSSTAIPCADGRSHQIRQESGALEVAGPRQPGDCAPIRHNTDRHDWRSYTFSPAR